MSLSAKLEVRNISHHHQRRTKPWRQVTCTKNWWSLAVWFLSYVNRQTDRQTLITILCNPTRVK